MPKKTHLTVNDFLETAFDIVKKNGWGKLSITAVAKHMGCSTMPVYSHFENLEALKDEVAKKGWDLIREYELKPYTGDAWIDQAIGYVFFARENSQLFACMLDGRNLELERRMLQKHWDYLTDLLKGYQGFDGLSPEQRRMIRYSRAIFTQGVATTVSKGLGKLRTDNEAIEKYMTISSQAILEGYRKVYNQNSGVVEFLGEHFQPVKDL
ncbi:TetR/AcrR family transcriptional regulator [Desulfospira joergensenii]|uniref:TetR/AcrR family transcriptional regulator n=1 Tax=Desulfospira joergensenii TaxID=53329 RepID=UPI0003B38B12|nr:TetR/AcrR family transcriptional regulator [Desulfospira joergensenii]